jgi:predicted ATP-dependent serine protease
MLNVKCPHVRNTCPEELDVCCQFCKMNYSPCNGKCSGCWDADQLSEVTVLRNNKTADIASNKMAMPLA